MSTDAEYMQRAIRLAAKGRYTTDPNPNVGCVIVNDGEIVGEGWHRRAGEAHAEIHALSQAGERARGATVYVTLEPCCHTGKTPPCANALVKAGVARVVAAMMDPNPLVAGRGLIRLHQAGIETGSGLLEEQARALNPGFIKRMVTGRPYVRVKLAMSLDGRTAMASGESRWITGEAARRDVQQLRAQSSAILTGISTVLYDDPSMNVRLSAETLGVDTVRQPKRIVLDSTHKMLSQARIFATEGESAGGECIVYTTVNVDNKTDYPYRIETVEARGGRIDLNVLLAQLGREETNLLHVEAGSILCGALLQEELVDEIVVYMAPHIVMGDEAKGLFHLPGLSQMQDRIKLKMKDLRHIGDDIRITLVPEKISGKKQ